MGEEDESLGYSSLDKHLLPPILRTLARNPSAPFLEFKVELEYLTDLRKLLVRKHTFRKRSSDLRLPNGAPPASPLPPPDRKRKLRPVQRCTSPTHFAIPEDELLRYCPDYLKPLPGRHKADSVLNSVAKVYYSSHTAQAPFDNAMDRFAYSTLDMLVSPLKKPSIWDTWTPREIALFESGICAVGKNFHQIQKMIGSKTTGQIVDFYYHWKKSSHYQMWKQHGRPFKGLQDGKLDHVRQIHEKLEGFL